MTAQIYNYCIVSTASDAPKVVYNVTAQIHYYFIVSAAIIIIIILFLQSFVDAPKKSIIM